VSAPREAAEVEADRRRMAAEWATVRAASARLGALAGAAEDDSPLLARFAERLEALVDEFGWELGAIDEAEVAGPRPALDHAGIVVADLGAAAELFAGLLGGTVVGGGEEDGYAVRSLHVDFPGGGRVELLAPTGPGGFEDFLAARGEGVHHLTILVEGLEELVEALTAEGHRVTGVDLATEGWHEAYLSPRSAHGCLIQLVETGPEFGRPVDGVTVADVLAGHWEWVDHRPRRRER
jgi:methylmalonyl-CoA/ethylmalonyl-CoA epimerase